MKKQPIIIVSILIIILSCFTSYVFWKKHEIHIANETLLKEESPRIEKYLKYNYNNIENVTFTKADFTGMGTPYIEGYINGDKDLYFTTSIYNNHFEKNVGMPLEIYEWAKYPVDKTVTEIQQQENSKNQ
ncbi:DUF1433 domain-containing protein [Listeria cossartiae subsp. cayugensis]|uniref:DUF1433 domain-containing protein n=1 Tax=Listeria cossartiae subsp. cayugensis TaxID=2713505 RepID=A0ABU2IRT2_9LIST|nr:DUF1433 domain-containing protein [Listeria cossartiae]MDT0050174.1 DUF1433 domain-containing protein [Listeria cossartiae subsp. cayugensis]MDT0066780.1 DUF1433 domain-containing protein [Listeria cossartiae subsp. cayugensis]MDT0080565.1 DUF1433 domain-containing protein [Listeria cossartiae subsp. cayugensis]MDT0082999.1 DUF1433 domain-containing protein [Listeria cossartiae subsp. cayugensis]MDT0088909.1 DUF1433 domain-containing protein [Listeria cossartiae subsp. cayugensis]